MASRRFPDNGTRYAAHSNGNWAASESIKYFSDPAGQFPAEVYADRGTDTPDPVDQLAGSTTTLDAYGGQVDFRGPTDGTKILYGQVGATGPIFRIRCEPQDQLDDHEDRLDDLEAGGAGDALLLHRAGAETVTGVKTFSAQPVVPTPTVSTSPTTKAYVDAIDLTTVHKTGAETVAGVKTFSSEPVVPTPTLSTSPTTKAYVDSGLAAKTTTAYVAGRVSGLTALKKMLDAGTRSCAIQVLSDSTANGVTVSDYDWPHLLGQKIAALYPAWTVHHRLWNDTTQDFDAPLVIQTGTAGGRYLDCDSGTAGLRLDIAASPHLSGTMDIRAKIREATWTPAAAAGYSVIVAKGSSSPSIEWRFALANSGLLNFFYSTAGTATVGIGSTATLASAGATPGSTKWVRCLFNPDDGAGNRVTKFYTSDDGSTWTQLGTTVTTAGAVTVFTETTTGYQLGALDGATAPGMDIFEVQVRNGDTGPNIVPALPDGWGVYGGATTNAVVSGAPVLNIVNGCNPGSGIPYLSDATRLPKLTPDYGQVVIFPSSSHNETRAMGAQWISRYNTWITGIRARLPHGALVPLTQNPELAGSAYQLMHGQRRIDLIAWARSAGLDVIDTYGAFLADGRDLTTVLLGDTIHPSVTGANLWADTIMAELAIAG